PGPTPLSEIPAYQGRTSAVGKRYASTQDLRHGADRATSDARIGTLTSKSFVIERRYIHLLIGGGKQPKKECVNLLIGGKVVRSVTGFNETDMSPVEIDVTEFAGQTAQLQIVDAYNG